MIMPVAVLSVTIMLVVGPREWVGPAPRRRIAPAPERTQPAKPVRAEQSRANSQSRASRRTRAARVVGERCLRRWEMPTTHHSLVWDARTWQGAQRPVSGGSDGPDHDGPGKGNRAILEL